jgi:two-component system response regulator NreC
VYDAARAAAAGGGDVAAIVTLEPLDHAKHPPLSTGLEHLSDRERKVFALSARGHTAAEIGEKLFLSPKTVETYRARATRKLGLETRSEVVALAIRAGLLDSI